MIEAIGSAIGNVFDGVKNVLGAWNAPQEQKIALQKAIDQAEKQIQTQQIALAEKVITAEMQQDDKYVKRMRPTIGYAGLVVVLLEIMGIRYILLNALGINPAIIESSTAALNAFWLAWGGVIGVYAGARTFEKLKAKDNVDN